MQERMLRSTFLAFSVTPFGNHRHLGTILSFVCGESCHYIGQLFALDIQSSRGLFCKRQDENDQISQKALAASVFHCAQGASLFFAVNVAPETLQRVEAIFFGGFYCEFCI